MHGCQSGSSERSKVRAAVTLMHDPKHTQKNRPATDGFSGLGREARLVPYFDAAAVEREAPPIDLPTLTHSKQVLVLHRYSWYMPMGYLT